MNVRPKRYALLDLANFRPCSLQALRPTLCRDFDGENGIELPLYDVSEGLVRTKVWTEWTEWTKEETSGDNVLQVGCHALFEVRKGGEAGREGGGANARGLTLCSVLLL